MVLRLAEPGKPVHSTLTVSVTYALALDFRDAPPMPSLSFRVLWKNHPGGDSYPCDVTHFKNQCAVRMSVAMLRSNVALDSFRGAVCYPGLKHEPRHVLRAQELANWLATQKAVVGTHEKKAGKRSFKDYVGRRGIVFIKDGWGPTDHIDVWDGKQMRMKGGSLEYFSRGRAIWFWDLP